jgi:O-antigen/teichoic acid export membrane protein
MGYVSIICNIIYTAASVPLALIYLSKEEFGLWALAQQVAGYLLMLDLGLSFSINRFLADQKEEIEGIAYCNALKTAFFAFMIQALLMFSLGVVLSLNAQFLFSINEDCADIFRNVLFILSASFSISFATRFFAAPLWAFQRMDFANIVSSVSLLSSFALLWIGFIFGLGVYSFAFSFLPAVFLSPVATYIFCKRNGYYPERLLSGSFNFAFFHKIFSFGKDVFRLALGSQLINASQMIILSQTCGLNEAAVFAIGSKVFSLICQVFYKIIESSSPVLTEMLIKNDRAAFNKRLSSLIGLTLFCACTGAAGLVLFNTQFVGFWTHGKVSWNIVFDLFLALLIILTAFTRWQVGIFGVLGDYSKLKNVYLAEGVLFAFTAFPLSFYFGIGGLLACSLLIHIFITYSVSFLHFKKSFPDVLVFRLFAFSLLSLFLLFFLSLAISFFRLNGIIEFALKSFAFFFYFGIAIMLVFDAFVRQEILRIIRSKSIW